MVESALRQTFAAQPAKSSLNNDGNNVKGNVDGKKNLRVSRELRVTQFACHVKNVCPKQNMKDSGKSREKKRLKIGRLRLRSLKYAECCQFRSVL